MSAVYNPEAETIAQIERLELAARELRRKVQIASNDKDKRVLDRQLKEIEQTIASLRSRLP